MKEYLTQISQCPLFDRIESEDLIKTLNCLNAQIMRCEKGKVIFRQGDKPRYFGAVLSGSVQVMDSDPSGNQNVLWYIGKGELFAETYAGANVDELPASFVAAQESLIMVLDFNRVINGCRNNGCLAHSRMITNLMRSMAAKNLLLNEKLEFVTRRTTREKLMAYLRAQQRRAQSSRFTIPLDRQSLADYLVADRSAMCAQLSLMKKEGLIDYRKNEFEILDAQEKLRGEEGHD